MGRWNIYLGGKLADVVEAETFSEAKKKVSILGYVSESLVITNARPEIKEMCLTFEEKCEILKNRINACAAELRNGIEDMLKEFDGKKH